MKLTGLIGLVCLLVFCLSSLVAARVFLATRLQIPLSRKSNTKDFAFTARYVRLRTIKSLAILLNQ